MAILSNNQRAPARSSSAAQQAQQQARRAPPDEPDDPEVELFQVGETHATLPAEILELPDLKNILSLETWNSVLSEEEREQLLALMPGELDQETFAATLKEILSGDNIFFGNPVEQLFSSMKEGLCQHRVVEFRQSMNVVQRKEHYHLIRKYHNAMVSSFVEMQKLWDEYPDVEIDGRLEIWRKWKETKVKPQLPSVAKSYENTSKKKAKAPEAPKNAAKKPAAGGKTSKGGAGSSKAGKPAPKPPKIAAPPARKMVNVKVEHSPLPEAGANEMLGGTSSSLTSGEKAARKRASVELEASVSSLEDDGLSDELDDTCRSPPAMERKMMGVSSHCESNLDSSNEEMDALLMRKESSESPQLNRLDLPFSVPLFLSAIRRALLTPFDGAPAPAAGAGEAGAMKSISGPSSPNGDDLGQFDDASGAFPVAFPELVRRVYTNPGDPRLLEVQEPPLQDLVWGALKILSSRVAPPGAKGWKPLATYDKESKSWFWIGPPARSGSGSGSIALDDWGVAPRMVFKVEEAFSSWYRHGEATRQQMAHLQLPPQLPVSGEDRARFRDMRAQKSLITISPSSEDMRAYFRKEEMLRYSVPDRAFAYTRLDGKKAVVAPLRRVGGKPNSKARDHFMLKPDRPPHVTILCLVRDAAARLPGSVGTRADVCALIRDSQYIVEDVTDTQVHQVVSGALDRLHYERDPCVRFDSERKLWLYLHTDRNEDDFEDDGTSSTKRWKKQQQQHQQQQHQQMMMMMPGFQGEEFQFESGSPEEMGGGAGGFVVEGGAAGGAPAGSSAIYSAGKAELVYNSKSNSLGSPRVLHNSSATGLAPGGHVPPASTPQQQHSSGVEENLLEIQQVEVKVEVIGA